MMPYQNPTLFGMVYASRLFREADVPSRYEEFRTQVGPMLNLQEPTHAHAEALLKWLNEWGCRIRVTSFPALSHDLAHWDNQWTANLPHANAELVDLTDKDLDILADAYEALLAVFQTVRRGATTAAKALFAVRPEAAMAWDGEIRSILNVSDNRQGYRDMLAVSKRELEMLIVDASQRGTSARRDIPTVIGSPGRTLVRLLDEYHWITITGGHQIPTCCELKQWAIWAC
jgi:hypothetical protein